MPNHSLTRCRSTRTVVFCLSLVTVCLTGVTIAPSSVLAQQADQVRAEPSEPSGSLPIAGPKPPAVPTPAPADLQRAIDRGIEFLLADQNQDGSWGTPERTKDLNIFAPVPGAHHAFRTAVTSLCLSR